MGELPQEGSFTNGVTPSIYIFLNVQLKASIVFLQYVKLKVPKIINNQGKHIFSKGWLNNM